MEYDNPWKEALELYFESFMKFFFKHIHLEIDWSKGYEFLDKELEKTLRDAEIGRRHADKLVKVFLLDGIETWLLIHIEIQGYKDNGFEKRMFVYNYRIFDRYEVEVVSLAVLTDDNNKWHPCEYHTERWGCENTFRFPIVKMLDYGKNLKKLEQDQNPFALVVMAHLKSQGVKDGQERKLWNYSVLLTGLLNCRKILKSSFKMNLLKSRRKIKWLM